MRYKIIVNPTSGRGEGAESIPTIQASLKEANLDFDLVQTERPWHAAELAQQAVVDGFDVVVSAGGDGTANEVINGIMQAKTTGQGTAALGVLTVGRGNDFAFSMGIPTELEEAIQTLIDNHRVRIDIGKVTGGLFAEGRYFGNGVGIGFDAVVGFEALKLKRLHGFPSYIVAALKTIFLYFKAPQVAIEYDCQPITMSALMVSIMNGRRMGGGFMMAPDASRNDGALNICIARQVSRLKIFTLIFKFMQGTQEEDPNITTCLTKSITVTAVKGTLPAHADGETLCVDGKKLVCEILPEQIELITA